MKRIKLTQGKFALVDDEDYEELSKHSWCAAQMGNEVRAIRGVSSGSVKKIIYMSREIMKAPKGLVVDHINRNPLDNRKENLRLCTFGQNMANLKINKKNTIGYKGVRLIKSSKRKWVAVIWKDHVSHYGGSYFTKEEAALAYNKMAIKYHGEFASLNFVPLENENQHGLENILRSLAKLKIDSSQDMFDKKWLEWVELALVDYSNFNLEEYKKSLLERKLLTVKK